MNGNTYYIEESIHGGLLSEAQINRNQLSLFPFIMN